MPFLSRNARPGPLLKTVNGKSIAERNAMKKQQDANAEACDITAPPESSDDEEQEPLLDPLPGLSDSDDDRPSGADIRKTKFQTRAPAAVESAPTIVRKSTRGKSNSSVVRGEAGGRPPRHDPPSYAGLKRSADDAEEPSGTYMLNDMGFLKNSSKKCKSQYGISSQKSSQQSAPSSSAGQRHGRQHANSFKRYSSSPLSSPRKGGSGSAFKQPADMSSPLKDPLQFRDPAASPDATPVKKNRLPFLYDDEELKSPARVRTSRSGAAQSVSRSQKGKTKNTLRSDGAEPLHAVIKIPELGELGELGVGFAEALSTETLEYLKQARLRAASHLSSEEDVNGFDPGESEGHAACCPMCHLPVDSALLEKHMGGGRQTVKKQAAFCRLHKRQDAQRICDTEGYPEVDWAGLERRMMAYRPFLQDICEGRLSSYFASVLRDKVAAGKDRTILKTDEKFVPGYYGPRGLRVMTEFIMRTLSETLRKRAVEDSLVSARGYSGYVQAVLVPELAVRLIMDDMLVSEAEAKGILERSVEVGELLHEEARDVVTKVDNVED